MKRLMLVCMAVVFMFGYAGVTSAQNTPPPIAHHQSMEGQPPGKFLDPNTKPPTETGTQYEGTQVTPWAGNSYSTPAAPVQPTPPTIAHHQSMEGQPPGKFLDPNTKPPTSVGTQYEGTQVTPWAGNSYSTPAAPVQPTPPTIAHHQSMEGQPPGKFLDPNTKPPTSVGTQYEGTQVTPWAGNSYSKPAAPVQPK